LGEAKTEKGQSRQRNETEKKKKKEKRVNKSRQLKFYVRKELRKKIHPRVYRKGYIETRIEMKGRYTGAEKSRKSTRVVAKKLRGRPTGDLGSRGLSLVFDVWGNTRKGKEQLAHATKKGKRRETNVQRGKKKVGMWKKRHDSVPGDRSGWETTVTKGEKKGKDSKEKGTANPPSQALSQFSGVCLGKHSHDGWTTKIEVREYYRGKKGGERRLGKRIGVKW